MPSPTSLRDRAVAPLAPLAPLGVEAQGIQSGGCPLVAGARESAKPDIEPIISTVMAIYN